VSGFERQAAEMVTSEQLRARARQLLETAKALRHNAAERLALVLQAMNLEHEADALDKDTERHAPHDDPNASGSSSA
jgi:hypothetical protein